MVFHKKQLLEKELSFFYLNNKKIGFVPTMGALHKGHLTLVELALQENNCVVVSIFVNPTQFDNTKDLKKYPRTLEQDVALLSKLSKNIYIYAPDPIDLYGKKVQSKNYSFGGIENQMEGKYRKGHFNGVGTVLNLLFRAINPTNAYFGEKDYQQLRIVKKLVEIEKLPIQIIGCSIGREPNGLAMSSRNKRLTDIQFQEAALIYKTLKKVQVKFKKDSIPKIHLFVENTFLKNNHLVLEYFEIAPISHLKPAKRKRKETRYRAFIAVFAGEVRLIDNIALN